MPLGVANIGGAAVRDPSATLDVVDSVFPEEVGDASGRPVADDGLAQVGLDAFHTDAHLLEMGKADEGAHALEQRLRRDASPVSAGPAEAVVLNAFLLFPSCAARIAVT